MRGALLGVFRDTVKVVSFVWTHPANRSGRMRALGRSVRFQVRGRVLRRPTLTPIGSASWMWAELHYVASSTVVYANPPDWNQMRVWRHVLRRGDLFVDVGANVGTYTMWASDCGADVIALEPDPETYLRLQANARLAKSRVRTVRAAATAFSGTAVLTSGRDSMNRLIIGGGTSGSTNDVPTVTLDEVIGDRHISGLKVDVEGAERLVLEGASRALAEHRIDLIQLEWNDASLECLGETRAPLAALLAAHGYELLEADADGVLQPTSGDTFTEDLFTRPRAPAAH
jgi:FkbM family methyltransferase